MLYKTSALNRAADSSVPQDATTSQEEDCQSSLSLYDNLVIYPVSIATVDACKVSLGRYA